MKTDKKYSLLFLVLSFFFLGLSIYFNSGVFKNYLLHTNQLSIQKEIAEYNLEFDQVAQSFYNKSHLQFSDFTSYYDKSYTITYSEGNDLLFWSNKKFIPEEVVSRMDDEGEYIIPYSSAHFLIKIRNLNDGNLIFIKSLTDLEGRINLLKKTITEFSFTTEKLTSESFPVKIKDKTLSYVNIDQSNDLKASKPLTVTWILFLCSVLFFFITLYFELDDYISKIHKIIPVIIGVILLTFLVEFDPLNVFSQMEFFQSFIYGNEKLGNLAQLNIRLHLLALLLLLWYNQNVIPHRYKKYFPYWLTLFLFTVVLAIATWGLLYILRSIVLDSSEDIYVFYNINMNVAFLLIAMLLSGYIYFFFSLRLIRYVNKVSSTFQLRLIFTLAVVFLSSVFILIFFKFKYGVAYIIWLICYYLGLLFMLSKSNKIVSFTSIIFCILISSVIATITFRFYNVEKEEIKIDKIARQLAKDQDALDKYLIENMVDSLYQDEVLKDAANFFSLMPESGIIDRVKGIYLIDELENFQSQIKLHRNLDTIHFNSNEAVIKLIEDNYEEFQYQIIVPFTNEDSLHYALEIDLVRDKLENNNSFYSLYHQNKKIRAENILSPSYSYSIYDNGKLEYVKGSSFNFNPAEFEDLEVQKLKKVRRRNQTFYVYKSEIDRFFILSSIDKPLRNNFFISLAYIFTIIIYSYIFYILLISRFRLTNLEIFRKSIANRTQFFLMSSIYAVAAIIGIISVSSLRSEFNKNQLRDHEIYLENVYSKFSFEDESKTNFERRLHFIDYLKENYQESLKDFHFFDEKGNIIYSNNATLFTDHIWPPKVNPVILSTFQQAPRIFATVDESVLDIHYKGYYLALRNNNQELEGILYVPAFDIFFKNARQEQVFTTTLLSTFAIVLFLISFVMLFFVHSFTELLKRIRERLSKVEIGKEQEELEWKNDDEIGLLVREYNNMVKKLDENAVMLARTERESAWRDMARQIAHEIKNPLTPMKLSIQHLKRTLSDKDIQENSQAVKTLDTLVSQINHLSNIANDFSSVSKMNLPSYQVVDIKEVLNEIVRIFQHNEKYEFKVVNQLNGQKEDEELIYADKTMLNRVFTNLMKNSVQALREDQQGKIEFRLSEDIDEYIISVVDNGKGIPIENRAKIFTPNFTTKKKGTGIGLMMSKKIIDFHDGKISFESKKDEGTTFTVRIPKYKKNEEQ